MTRLPLACALVLGLALVGCNDIADPTKPDGPGVCEMGSAMRKHVELVKATFDYVIAELDTDEVKSTYEFTSSSSWGYYYSTEELCAGLDAEMKSVTPGGMYESDHPTASSMLRGDSRIIWNLLEANLTTTEEVCEEGPEWRTDEAGNRVVTTNPCIRKVTRTVHLQGWEEGSDLAESLDWLARRIGGVCDDGALMAKQDTLDDLKATRAAIDGRILENGAALFVAIQCAPEEAFAKLIGGFGSGTDLRVSSRSAARRPAPGDPASRARRPPAVNAAI